MSGCWLWTGPCSPNGYGYFGRTTAHRWIYQRTVGPAREHLHHHCGVRLCVNPRHLSSLDTFQHKSQHHKTHCKRGHALTNGNLYKYEYVTRCRTCVLDRSAGRL